jgi:phosphoribosylformylglycinamidine synthase subunit PurQ / glutaminase
MPIPHILVLRAPGTNCDQETAFAFERAGGKSDILHINRLLENPGLFRQFQILCIPGGFSYGDDLAAGRILGSQIQHHLADALAAFKADGKLILGICNGFQVLMKSSVLLQIDPAQGPAATLTLNDSGRYEDRWVRLAAGDGKCVFFAGIESMYLPVAHAEGKFVTRNADVLGQLQASGQCVLRYVSQTKYAAQKAEGGGQRAEGTATATASLAAGRWPLAACSYPDNPNGSMADTAGVCDATGRVLGLMPHPERHIDPTQHPRWTRGEAGPVGDGLQVFVNAVGYFS